MTEEMGLQHQQMIDKIKELEMKLEDEERKCVQADTHIKELEYNLVLVRNNVRKVAICKLNTTRKEKDFLKKLSELSKQYNSFEKKAIKFIRHAALMKSTLLELDLKISMERDAYQTVKADMDYLLVEIQSLEDGWFPKNLIPY